jgi:hypothetical protein
MKSDMTAIGAMSKSYEDDVVIPHDLSLVGFDDLRLAQFMLPPLTTVQMSQAELARLALEAFLADVDRQDPMSNKDRIGTPDQFHTQEIDCHSSGSIKRADLHHTKSIYCLVFQQLSPAKVGSLCPEPLLRPHPKRQNRSNQQDRNAAEKRKIPVPCLVDHVSEHQRRNDGGERRTDIHEAASGA